MGFSYNDITSKSMGLKARLTCQEVSLAFSPMLFEVMSLYEKPKAYPSFMPY